ncbi:receptor-like protein EIX2 [Elaeis guineensis]|uniref:receptor-like protein EIX2 n=1 Tax=Elaeis guineensis var. tenera TaxID=51953 RepID=UPI003C6D5C57
MDRNGRYFLFCQYKEIILLHHTATKFMDLKGTQLLLLLLFFAFLCAQVSKLNGDPIPGCIPIERNALLGFKEGLKDPTNRLSSWVGDDCCTWEGVACDNRTGHVVKLDLRNPHPFSDIGDLPYNHWSLGGELKPSLLGLKYLNYLDLSMNHFGGIRIPEFMGSFRQLKYLNISRAGLGGIIPHQIGNLSSLQYLDLYNDLDPSFIVPVREFSIDNASGFLIFLLCGISICRITIPVSLPHVNFSSLSVLDLSMNSINSAVPGWLFNISSLEYLDLSDNSISVIIPPAIKSLASLNFLDLNGNPFLEGKIATALGDLCKLQHLGLSNINISKNLNEFDEVFAGCIKNSLETLHMQNTQLSGYLPEWLGDFKMLKSLHLYGNSISGPLPASLGRLSALQEFYLSYNKLNGTIPRSLGRLAELHRNCEHIARLVLEVIFPIQNLDISNNGITGRVPDLIDFIYLESFNLSSNHFEGPLPNFNSPMLSLLDLSNNSFSGVIHPDIGKSMPNLIYLSLSTNNLSGEIPLSLCQLDLFLLDLSKNLLFGELPYCWNHSLSIMVMDFSSNNLSGSIPPSICSLPNLESLHLSDNNLSGELPLSLKSCVHLNTLDLGQNEFTGAMPTWIGESLLSLKILSLRSNKLVGNIPPNLSRLSALQILDLAHNNLSGSISSRFGNFTAMKVLRKTYETILDNQNEVGAVASYKDKIQVTIKGTNIEYAILLPLVIAIDLSDNNLSGIIPKELTNLFGLMSLNLSGNHLTGEITEKISALQQLESLDLSRNNLFGGIPSSMIALTFLSYLNLSYNNLSGKIPTGNQFQTFSDPSIYAGNPGLCGFPLPQKCKDNETNHSPNAIGGDEQNDNAMDEEGFDMKWLYMGMGPGFALGFWTIFGPLLFNRKWREAYFRHIDQVYDMVYVAVAVFFARFKEHRVGA